MVINTGLENLCSIKDNAKEMAKEIIRLFEKPFEMDEKQKRKKILYENFSNVINVKKLLELSPAEFCPN